MYVEQRYAIEVARGFEARGEKLLHAPTGKKLNTFTGGFTADADPPPPRPPPEALLVEEVMDAATFIAEIVAADAGDEKEVRGGRR